MTVGINDRTVHHFKQVVLCFSIESYLMGKIKALGSLGIGDLEALFMIPRLCNRKVAAGYVERGSSSCKW